MDTTTSRKFPPAPVYVLLAGWIGAVVAIGFIADVRTATYALAVSLLVFAFARVVLPDGAVPRVRSKAHDAVVAVIFAVLLIALAPWGNTPPV